MTIIASTFLYRTDAIGQGLYAGSVLIEIEYLVVPLVGNEQDLAGFLDATCQIFSNTPMNSAPALSEASPSLEQAGYALIHTWKGNHFSMLESIVLKSQLRT